MDSKFACALNPNFEHVAATAYHHRNESLTLEHIATHDFHSFANMLEKAMTSQQDSIFKVP